MKKKKSKRKNPIILIIIIVIFLLFGISECSSGDTEEILQTEPYNFTHCLSTRMLTYRQLHVDEHLFFDYVNNIAVSVEVKSRGDDRYRLLEVFKITVDSEGNTYVINQAGETVGYFGKFTDELAVWYNFITPDRSNIRQYQPEIINKDRLNELTRAGFFEQYPDPALIQ